MRKAKIGIPGKYFVCAVLIFLSYCMAAQQTLALQQCIDIAIKNNLAIRQREFTRDATHADLLQSKMNTLPSLNGQLTNNFNTGFAINPATNAAEENLTFRNNSMGLASNMTLFNGFQLANNVRLQQSNLKASEQDVESVRNQVRLNVANAYMQVLMNLELDARNRLQTDFTRQQVTRQEKLYEVGAVNRVKLLQLKAQLANEELLVISGKNQLDQSYLTLWQLMNVAPDTSNHVVVPEIDAGRIEDEPKTVSDIYREYLDQSPDVKAARQRLRSAELSRYVSLGGRSPRISVNGTLSSFYSTQTQQPLGSPVVSWQPLVFTQNGTAPVGYYPVSLYPNGYEVTPFSKQFDRNLGKALGFTMTVPIFNGWSVNTNVQKSKINEQSSKAAEEQVRNDLFKNITQAYQDFKAARKRYEASQNSFDANRESFTLAENQFNLGALNTTDYLNTKNEFLKAQASLVQAKYELVFRRKVLDFYEGRQL